MKITYDDKVSLITSPLPEENKVTDDDMNEIKNVVNKNFGDLLWTNPDVESGMAQNDEIALDLSNYTSVRIIYKVIGDDDNSRYIEREMEIGYKTSVDHITPYTNQASVVIRQRTLLIETTGITSDNPTKHTIGSTNSYDVPDVTALVPYKIYGIG